MTRAPFVTGKASEPFARTVETYDTTLGWRFVNPAMKARYGIDSMAETGENVAEEYQVARKDQDAFALRSQQRAARAAAAGYFAEEIVAVEAPGGKAGPIVVDKDEHPRPDTTLDNLAKLKPIVRNPGTITAGNASGINDGAAAMILASEEAASEHGLTPRARVVGMASAAVPPRIMGIGPVPSTRKLMERLGLKIGDFDLIEINEAFASQGLACLRQLGVADDAEHVNPHGGAIALGHPLGMSGARLAMTAVHGLEQARRQARARHDVRRRRARRFAGAGADLARHHSGAARGAEPGIHDHDFQRNSLANINPETTAFMDFGFAPSARPGMTSMEISACRCPPATFPFIPTRRDRNSSRRPAPSMRTATCSGRRANSPSRRSANTPRAMRRRKSCSRCATFSASTRTSSCRPRATPRTTGRRSTRSKRRTGGRAASLSSARR